MAPPKASPLKAIRAQAAAYNRLNPVWPSPSPWVGEARMTDVRAACSARLSVQPPGTEGPKVQAWLCKHDWDPQRV